MAEGVDKENNISASTKRFSCAICLDLLKEPVTIPCGHNYCMVCITACWDRQEEDGVGCRCPQCRMSFSPRPVLCRNPLLAEMVEELRDTAGGEGEEPPPAEGPAVAPGEVECTACVVGRKRKADKSCLDCLASYCGAHFNRHEELHSGKRHKVVAAVSCLEDRMCSKHNRPLEVWCRTDQVCVCPLCILDDHKGHDVITAAAAKAEKQSTLSWSYKEQITQRQEELEQLIKAAEPFKRSVKTALDASDRTLKDMITFLESKFSELKQLIRAREHAVLSEADQFAGRLQNILLDLQQKDSELQRLSHIDDPIHFLQHLPSRYHPQDLHIDIVSCNYFGAVHASMSKLSQHVKECLQNNANNVTSEVKQVEIIEGKNRKELMQHFCRLIFDRDSAFRHHDISEDGMMIDWRHKVTNCYIDHDARFKDVRQVFCTNALRGRHYWEVWWRVGDGYYIKIAISYPRSSMGVRERESVFGTNDKSWSLLCSNSGFEFQHDNETIKIERAVTSTVGVFVDRHAGILAFYGIYGEKATLLHRARARFSENPYPGFYVDHRTTIKLCNKKKIN